MIKTILLVLSLCMTFSVFGQDFLRLNREPVDPIKLKKIYDHYVENDFSEIANDLVKQLGENPLYQSYISKDHSAEPWKHSLALTLSKAWRFHTNYAARKEPRGKVFESLMLLIEDDKVGSGRQIVLCEIATRLHWGCDNDMSLPPLKDTIRRLSSIVLDETEDSALRRFVVPILYEHGDPNNYLDLAIKLTSTEPDSLSVSEAFRFATPARNSNRLSVENRSKYLNYGFKLLQDVDDKESGHGYFLALHLGDVEGVNPEKPFKPDQSLPRYDVSEGGGMNPSYFQDTVDNALKWWTQNQDKYSD